MFGPRPRNYSFKLNKGLKRLARISALSLKAKEDKIMVIEDFNFEAPKTKNFISLLKGLDLENKKSLFVLAESNNNVYLSSRNLSSVKTVKTSELNTYGILNAKKIIISETCLEQIETNFTKQ
jgi:large subunit ribosomal protein L4